MVAGGSGGKEMTAQEKITIQRVAMKLDNTSSKLDDYIKDDIKWKKNFDDWKTTIVEPLIKKEADNIVVHNWLKDKSFFLIKVVGLIATCIGIVYYITRIAGK